MSEAAKETEFTATSLFQALEFLDLKDKNLGSALQMFQHQRKELTGHSGNAAVTDLDVVRIVCHVLKPYLAWLDAQIGAKGD